MNGKKRMSQHGRCEKEKQVDLMLSCVIVLKNEEICGFSKRKEEKRNMSIGIGKLGYIRLYKEETTHSMRYYSFGERT